MKYIGMVNPLFIERIISKKECINCDSKNIKVDTFTNEMFKETYKITGLCQSCQEGELKFYNKNS